MDKYARLREALLREGVLEESELIPAPLATVPELEAAHDADYVAAVLQGTLDPRAVRRLGFPWSPALVLRSRASVGGALAAARAALSEGVAGVLAGGTHHAFANAGEGFCVFNDLAVVSRVLLREGRVRRLAIVDLDVHQGNGTAAILGTEPRVFLLSLHGEKNFPFSKVPSTLDLALPDGTEDAEYLEQLSLVLPAVVEFQPELVLYLAGVDPLREDTLGRLALSHAGLEERDRRVFRAFRSRGVPVACVLGGGYARPIERSVRAHVGTYRALRAVSRDSSYSQRDQALT
jgi:acetoin utilization deacetylase AcuC-like enzyme